MASRMRRIGRSRRSPGVIRSVSPLLGVPGWRRWVGLALVVDPVSARQAASRGTRRNIKCRMVERYAPLGRGDGQQHGAFAATMTNARPRRGSFGEVENVSQGPRRKSDQYRVVPWCYDPDLPDESPTKTRLDEAFAHVTGRSYVDLRTGNGVEVVRRLDRRALMASCRDENAVAPGVTAKRGLFRLVRDGPDGRAGWMSILPSGGATSATCWRWLIGCWAA